MGDETKMLAGTMQTDPRSGHIKKSSGVNPLPIIAETWAKVRDNSDPNTDWLIAAYDGNSKTDVTVLRSGGGGIAECARNLPDDVCFGGCRRKTGRFTKWFYAPEAASVMKKGRASMHRNGVLNVLEGCDDEIEMRPELALSDM